MSQSSAKTPSVIKLPNIKPLMKLSHPLGVVAGRSHAVVWNTRAIYTWGTNFGQLGHPQEDKIVPAPKRVSINSTYTMSRERRHKLREAYIQQWMKSDCG